MIVDMDNFCSIVPFVELFWGAIVILRRTFLCLCTITIIYRKKDLFLSISKVNRIEVNCAFMLHRSMRITAFLVVYVAMSILEQTNLWVHCLTDLIWLRQKCLPKGFKELHIMVQDHVHLQRHADIKPFLHLLEVWRDVSDDSLNELPPKTEIALKRY